MRHTYFTFAAILMLSVGGCTSGTTADPAPSASPSAAAVASEGEATARTCATATDARVAMAADPAIQRTVTYTDAGADAAIAERNARVDVHLASVHIESGTRPRVADAVRTWVDRVTTSKAKLAAHTWTAADSNALAARERVVEVVCQ